MANVNVRRRGFKDPLLKLWVSPYRGYSRVVFAPGEELISLDDDLHIYPQKGIDWTMVFRDPKTKFIWARHFHNGKVGKLIPLSIEVVTSYNS